MAFVSPNFVFSYNMKPQGDIIQTCRHAVSGYL